jgi:hypothetical protein
LGSILNSQPLLPFGKLLFFGMLVVSPSTRLRGNSAEPWDIFEVGKEYHRFGQTELNKEV